MHYLRQKAPLHTLLILFPTLFPQTALRSQEIQTRSRAASGGDKTGLTVGCAKLKLKSNEICIGDHERVIEEGDAVGDRCFWEKLQKNDEWYKHGIYEFEYGSDEMGKGIGSRGERSKYTWRRVRCGWAKAPNEWELRSGGKENEGGDLLAVWKRESKWKSVKQGRLEVKKRFEGVEGGKEEGKWEVAVVLSLMVILENYVRRD